jgi:hypothetical protein
MKKMLKTSALILALALTLALPAFAADEFLPDSNQKFQIDGVTQEFGAANYAGFTLAPLRVLCAALGVPDDDEHIQYVAQDKSVTIISADGATKLWLQQGNTAAWIEKDGVKTDVTLDCGVQNYEGSLYLPMRFIAEGLGNLVVYDSASRTVLIRTPESLAAVNAFLTPDPEAETPAKMQLALKGKVSDATEEADFTMDFKMDSTDVPNLTKFAAVTDPAELTVGDLLGLLKLKLALGMDMTYDGETGGLALYMDGEAIYFDLSGAMAGVDPSMDQPMKIDLAQFEALLVLGGVDPDMTLEELMTAMGGTSAEDYTAALAQTETLLKEIAARTFVEDNTVTMDLSFLYDPASGLIPSEATAGLTMSKYLMTITLDEETKLPSALTMEISMAVGADTLDVAVDAEITYDDAVEITVPAEIKDNAADLMEDLLGIPAN